MDQVSRNLPLDPAEREAFRLLALLQEHYNWLEPISKLIANAQAALQVVLRCSFTLCKLRASHNLRLA